jgi:hypothetical protein
VTSTSGSGPRPRTPIGSGLRSSRVAFDVAWPRRTIVELWGLEVPVIGREDLITTKLAAGRPQDLADVAELERG